MLLVAGAAYSLDRITKALAESRLAGRPPIQVIPHVLQLNFTTNPGGAFSLFGSAPWLFAGASVAVSLAIAAAAVRLTSIRTAAGLGLILGGAMGNLTDRIVRGPGLSGRVVDFIDVRMWPVFNLADSAIVIGAALVLLAGARRRA